MTRADARADLVAAAPIEHEVVTPLASNEAGPNVIIAQRRGHDFRSARTARSLANPQTPWSPHEAGLNTYGEDMHERSLQVAEVERAHIAAAHWNAQVASASDTSLAAPAAFPEGTGSTSGIGIQGSNERVVDPSLQSSSIEPSATRDLRSDATLPSEVDRTGAMRPEYAVPVTEYNTVGILEMPAQPGDRTVWSVEPLTPGADIATGSTVYVVPEGPQTVMVPEIRDSNPLANTGDRSAGASPSEGAEANTPSPL
jgi:hypothetical protein